MFEPDYHDVYVYGNVIVNDLTKPPFASNMIHFGFDNSPAEAKRGTLFFYNNTVYIKGDTDDYWYVRLFDVTSDGDPATEEGTIAMFNNIIHKEGTTNLELMRDSGTLNFYANNWIREGYTELGYGSTAQVNYIAQPIVGSDPGFKDTANEDFTLLEGSVCIDTSGALPDSVQTKHPVQYEYVKHASMKNRALSGSAYDLGAFEYESATALEDESFIQNPEDFRLIQNFPNPFNPATVIRYQLPVAAEVELTIYNALGQKIKTLVNGHREKGRYNITFDAGMLPGGIYIALLKYDNRRQAVKMILLR